MFLSMDNTEYTEYATYFYDNSIYSEVYANAYMTLHISLIKIQDN